MNGYVTEIKKKTATNENFREVLFTTQLSQLVMMRLKAGEDIGAEVHQGIDQFIRVESGEGKAVLNGDSYDLKAGFAVVIPSGVEHNIINTSDERELKLYTIYTPPEHPDGRIHPTKADAEADEHHH